MVTVTMTQNEAKVFVQALENYRRNKGAERMLKCQKDNTLYPAYDKLMEVIKTLQAKVTE